MILAALGLGLGLGTSGLDYKTRAIIHVDIRCRDAENEGHKTNNNDRLVQSQKSVKSVSPVGTKTVYGKKDLCNE